MVTLLFVVAVAVVVAVVVVAVVAVAVVVAVAAAVECIAMKALFRTQRSSITHINRTKK